ncbi:MAG: fibronectin-binding domain-containing protein [Synergistaceae bacterium]|nr:fibronectin-binding domain-containing protein [Synergistaceae bacterium]
MSYGPELIYEWNRTLKNAASHRIQKVDGGDSWCIFSLSNSQMFLISWGAQNFGLTFVSRNERKILISLANQTPTIISALKSHISGAEFVGSEQIRRDRILRLTFKKTLGAGFYNLKYLVLEAMEHHSNLILLDEDESILQAAKHIHPSENRYRSILPGEKYVLPPEFKGISLEEWLDNPSQDTLKDIIGLGRPLIKSISTMSEKSQKKNLACFYKESFDKMKAQKLGKYVTVFPEILDTAITITNVEFTSKSVVLNPLLDKGVDLRKKKISQFLTKEIIRRERQIEDINNLLKNRDYENYKKYGEMIVANIWQIKHGSSEALLTHYNSKGVEFKEKVPFNTAISPSENAALYFKKYKKIKGSQERAYKLLENILNELNDLNEDLVLAMCSNDPSSLSIIEDELKINKRTIKNRKTLRKSNYPPHKRFYMEDTVVLAGLSAKGNRYATFKFANPDDIWFHVQNTPGAHVILRIGNTQETTKKETLLRFCSSLAVYYSRARGNNGIRVDYTLKKYVSPIRGEIANVTYREFKSMSADSDFWEKYLSENPQVQQVEG